MRPDEINKQLGTLAERWFCPGMIGVPHPVEPLDLPIGLGELAERWASAVRQHVQDMIVTVDRERGRFSFEYYTYNRVCPMYMRQIREDCKQMRRAGIVYDLCTEPLDADVHYRFTCILEAANAPR